MTGADQGQQRKRNWGGASRVLRTITSRTREYQANGAWPRRDGSLDVLDAGAEARSRATMLDVPCWAEHHGYQAIIVENVLEIFDWILIEEWFAMMAKLGYRWQVCSFNRMFFRSPGLGLGLRPPQSRREQGPIAFWTSLLWRPHGFSMSALVSVRLTECGTCRS